MAGLDHHSKLITPVQAFVLLLVGSIGAIWYFDVDVGYHLLRFRDTILNMFGGVPG